MEQWICKGLDFLDEEGVDGWIGSNVEKKVVFLNFSFWKSGDFIFGEIRTSHISEQVDIFATDLKNIEATYVETYYL
jgi:hypothetical protein